MKKVTQLQYLSFPFVLKYQLKLVFNKTVPQENLHVIANLVHTFFLCCFHKKRTLYRCADLYKHHGYGGYHIYSDIAETARFQTGASVHNRTGTSRGVRDSVCTPVSCPRRIYISFVFYHYIKNIYRSRYTTQGW